jgi:hypothetical protein
LGGGPIQTKGFSRIKSLRQIVAGWGIERELMEL